LSAPDALELLADHARLKSSAQRKKVIELIKILADNDHRIVGEYGATGTSDIKAEYIWLMPKVGATGPTVGDDGFGGYMPLATAFGQAGTLNWPHTHHQGAPILATNAAGTVV
jgi:hypothetical protein